MSFNPRRPDAQAGFTLIETLLAVATLATVAVLVFASLSSTIRVVDAVRDDASREQVIRSSLRQMADELATASVHTAVPWIGQNRQQDGQPADTVAFLSTAQIRLHDNAAETEMARVVYTREGDRLVRLARRNLYGVTDDWIDRLDLANKVLGFNVRYYDPLSQVWVDEWDGRGRQSHPRAVLIELTLQPDEEGPSTFHEWVMVGASS